MNINQIIALCYFKTVYSMNYHYSYERKNEIIRPEEERERSYVIWVRYFKQTMIYPNMFVGRHIYDFD